MLCHLDQLASCRMDDLPATNALSSTRSRLEGSTYERLGSWIRMYVQDETCYLHHPAEPPKEKKKCWGSSVWGSGKRVDISKCFFFCLKIPHFLSSSLFLFPFPGPVKKRNISLFPLHFHLLNVIFVSRSKPSLISALSGGIPICSN